MGIFSSIQASAAEQLCCLWWLCSAVADKRCFSLMPHLLAGSHRRDRSWRDGSSHL